MDVSQGDGRSQAGTCDAREDLPALAEPTRGLGAGAGGGRSPGSRCPNGALFPEIDRDFSRDGRAMTSELSVMPAPGRSWPAAEPAACTAARRVAGGRQDAAARQRSFACSLDGIVGQRHDALRFRRSSSHPCSLAVSQRVPASRQDTTARKPHPSPNGQPTSGLAAAHRRSRLSAPLPSAPQVVRCLVNLGDGLMALSSTQRRGRHGGPSPGVKPDLGTLPASRQFTGAG